MACVGDLLHAESMTKVSSTPIPRRRKGAARFNAMNSTCQYVMRISLVRILMRESWGRGSQWWRSSQWGSQWWGFQWNGFCCEDLDFEGFVGDLKAVDHHHHHHHHPQVAGESKASKDGKDGGEESKETDQWLGTNLKGWHSWQESRWWQI